jgi:cell division protein FtsQ
LWNLGVPSLRQERPIASPGLRRDPAPSLWSYRYQRLMLTPAFRRGLRWGLPGAGAVLLGLLLLVPEANRAAVAARVEAVRDSLAQRPQFMVTRVTVLGADRALEQAIRAIAPGALPVSSFDIDPDALHARITALTAVRSATLRVTPGGALEIEVVQRRPVAVWRHVDGLRLIDAEGVMTGMIQSRGDRADLPLIAGDGAKDHIAEALALFEAAAPVAPRLRGLVRMGERRWDLVLEGDLRILLPTEDPISALERVLALHQARDLLDRDIAVVDMRLAHRPTIRLNQPALAVLRNAAAGAAARAASAPPPPGDEE